MISINWNLDNEKSLSFFSCSMAELKTSGFYVSINDNKYKGRIR